MSIKLYKLNKNQKDYPPFLIIFKKKPHLFDQHSTLLQI